MPVSVWIGLVSFTAKKYSFNLFVSILSSRRMDKLTIVYSTGHV